MIVLIFFSALAIFLVIAFFAFADSCRNANKMSEEEWKELDRDLLVKHLEDYNK
jgi:hypothetical protein